MRRRRPDCTFCAPAHRTLRSTSYLVDAAVPLTPRAGCTAVTDREVTCPTSAASTGPYIDAGAGDDVVSFANLNYLYDYFSDSGPGADHLMGGPGIDEFNGDNGADTLEGGAYGDVLDGGAGNDSVLGGPGDDEFIEGREQGSDLLYGGTGLESASYATKNRAALFVSLDGKANDGTAGEHDNVFPSVEGLSGWAGDDTFIGNGQPNQFWAVSGCTTSSKAVEVPTSFEAVRNATGCTAAAAETAFSLAKVMTFWCPGLARMLQGAALAATRFGRVTGNATASTGNRVTIVPA
jgi:RTX calcium-binding nonapeptide repeat (4 copies)